MKSSQVAELTDADAEKLQALIEALEEDDDVVNVHTNANIWSSLESTLVSNEWDTLFWNNLEKLFR